MEKSSGNSLKILSEDENSLLPCKLIYGGVSDIQFNKSHICIVVPQNSVSCRNYGCTNDVVGRYSYGDIAGLRFPCSIMKCYSILEDRSPEGSVYLKHPPIYSKGPTIATLITQYGIGLPIEENNFAKKIVKNCTDVLITSRLASDTLENRVSFFNNAMYKLSVRMRNVENDRIKKIMIPVGIGRRGRVDTAWINKYSPIISAFAKDMLQCGKEVCLVINKSYHDFLKKKYENCDSDEGVFFNKLNELPFLTDVVPSIDSSTQSNSDQDGKDVPDTLFRYILE